MEPHDLCQLNVSITITEFLAECEPPYTGEGVCIEVCDSCVDNDLENLKLIPFIALQSDMKYKKSLIIEVERLEFSRDLALVFYSRGSIQRSLDLDISGKEAEA